LPPENANAQLAQDLGVDDASHFAVRLDYRPDQRVEVEQEGLLHDVEGGDSLGELVEPRHTHVDGPGGDRIDNLIVDVELSLVEDLERDGLVAPFDLLLEMSEGHAPEAFGERHL